MYLQVSSSPDMVACGAVLEQSLTHLISSNDLLNQLLISAANGRKLTKLLIHLIRLAITNVERTTPHRLYNQ